MKWSLLGKIFGIAICIEMHEKSEIVLQIDKACKVGYV